MKKIFVIFLILSMLIPEAVSVNAKGTLYTVMGSSYFETGKWYTGGLSGEEGTSARYSLQKDATAGWNIKIEKNGYYRATSKTVFAQLPLKNKGDLCC